MPADHPRLRAAKRARRRANLEEAVGLAWACLLLFTGFALAAHSVFMGN